MCRHTNFFLANTVDGKTSLWMHSEQKEVVVPNGPPSPQNDTCFQGRTFAWVPIVFLGKFLIVADVCLKCS